ncbi:Dabb family protein [Ktedonosporobacter rubrisoli]|uniref:Dabb family protein n=1 Tax=Ktedonosporobacter rubrisoli TaxID=2509675 RepID=A0A4V0YYR5_KTERU|nr:Dabb family protein [Ktedonosporobacter rubrisoli]QBD77141.1 Dabb family protein [Ktedonosporobacter rubrisoli]
MIRHLIVFNTPEGVGREQCLSMAERARQELSRIPGVLHISFGVAVTENSRYSYTFVIDLRDESTISSYRQHPIHIAFADEHFRPLALDRITTDYEIVY